MNPEAALRRLRYLPKPGGKHTRRVEAERERRDGERQHLERISRLFKPRRPWQRKEVLGLGEIIFLIDGRD